MSALEEDIHKNIHAEKLSKIQTNKSSQKHFLCTIFTPFSMNSDFEIHIAVNVANELKIDPPIQAKNFLYAGSVTFIFVPGGTNDPSSFESLSPVPGKFVDPPLKTMFVYKSFRTSRSHFIMD